jgi:uncharacterized protein YcaQ
MNVRRLAREEARRIAVRAQLLDAERPHDLGAVVDQLTFLQLDPTAAIAPSADLVAWSRLGSAYEPDHLRQALERDRTLFEHRSQPTVIEPPLAMVRPMADLGLFLAEMAAWPAGSTRRRDWMRANDPFRRRVLAQLRESGPLASRDILDTSEVPWQSSGWTHDRNVTQMLQFLGDHGDVAVAARRGRQRLWDLAERVYPADTPVVPADEALRERNRRRLRSLGIARQKGTAIPIDSVVVGDAGEPATVEGVPGTWRVDPEALGQPFEGRTALLSPFDRLPYDRARAVQLFDFEYVLEMYKPKEKRRWGLPILHHDRLVGKLDATADRKSSTLQVNAIHQDVPFTRAVTRAVDQEIAALASWLGLESLERHEQGG